MTVSDENLLNLNHIIYTDLDHLKRVYHGLDCLYKITNPTSYDADIEFYKKKMEDVSPANVKSYYKNHMKSLFFGAELLIKILNYDDEKYLNITISEIKLVLKNKRIEYNIN